MTLTLTQLVILIILTTAIAGIPFFVIGYLVRSWKAEDARYQVWLDGYKAGSVNGMEEGMRYNLERVFDQ